MKKLLVLDSKADAIAFKNRPFQVDEILSLNPTVEAELKSSKYSCVNTLAKYDNAAHSNTAIKLQQAIQEISSYLKKLNYSELVIAQAQVVIFAQFSAAYFLHQTISGFEKYYWYKNGKLQTANNSADLISNFLNSYVKSVRIDRDFLKRSFLHKFILKRYNSYIATRFQAAKKVFILDEGRPQVMSFVKELKKINPDYVLFSQLQPGRNIWQTTKYIKKSFKRLRKDPNSIISFFYFAQVSNNSPRLNLSEISSNLFRNSFYEKRKSYIESSIYIADALIEKGAQLVQQFKPEIIVLDAITNTFKASACKELKQIGGKVVYFNHATNTPQNNPEIKQISNIYASQGLLYNPLATHNILRSPKMAELAEEIYGKEAKQTIIPVSNKLKILKAPHQKFRIIYAGNYLPIRDHVPIIAETPDEFAHSIIKFAEAVSQIPNAELVIKLKKRKKECTQEAIETLMPKYNNVSINSTASFKEELKNCDLVVANLTSTIDEALESWTPVLLYSANNRYSHLEGMSSPPNSDNRSAVYKTHEDLNLVDFIKSIMAAHTDKPLEHNEIAPFIWDEEADNMDKVVKKVLNS